MMMMMLSGRGREQNRISDPDENDDQRKTKKDQIIFEQDGIPPTGT